ncbi:MAG: ribonuclease T [Xenococcus sp. (in: cyanobacteria)]
MIYIFKRLFFLTLVLCFSFTIWANSAQASIKINNEFKATSSCKAFRSIKKRTNPGNISTVSGETYLAKEKNKPDATYYRLEFEDANPSLRWVSVYCGELLGAPVIEEPENEEPNDDDNTNNSRQESTDNLLAISWQPAFCQTHSSKEECKTQNEDRFDAVNFTLHGLWPQPKGYDYCGVSKENEKLDKSKKWSQLPPITLSNELFEELSIKMPGVASYLHLHEWYKHGTCYNTTPEEYFRESLILLDQVNKSAVQDLFASNIGQEITFTEIENNFVEDFGDEADDKVQVRCKGGLITELWLNLDGTIEPDTKISELFENAPDTSSRCSVAEVDEVGLD